MFKVGDIVFCINNYYSYDKPSSSLMIYLKKDKPYTVYSVSKHHIILKGYNTSYFSKRFISEAEYNKISRKDKINKINKINK